MNSAMQCIANSPFMRDFFTGISNKPIESDEHDDPCEERKEPVAPVENSKEYNFYKYQVNPNNVMGHKGDFVSPFADAMFKMWDSSAYFSVYPWSFKGALGKVSEQF